MHFSDTFVISFWQTQASSDDATRMLHASSGRLFWGQNFFWCQNLFQVIYNHNLRSNVPLQFFVSDWKLGSSDSLTIDYPFSFLTGSLT